MGNPPTLAHAVLVDLSAKGAYRNEEGTIGELIGTGERGRGDHRYSPPIIWKI